MSAEPINIFSRKIDPRGVVQALRSLAPTLQVIGPEECWEKIIISGPKRLFRKATTLTFNHDPEYYAGSGWPQQVMGMQGYFSRFPGIDERPEILRLISSFRFALATAFEPDLYIDSDDSRLAYLFAIVKHLDGDIFTPFGLRDANGKVLIGADGEYDLEAKMPQIPNVTSTEPEASSGEAAQEDDLQPPTAERVAQRALTLAAVTARALLEQEDAADPMVEVRRTQLLDWVAAIDIGDELEPDEWKALQRPVGMLEPQAAVNATWRLEGLAVLAWSLKRFDLPAYDQLADPRVLLHSVCFLDEQGAQSLIASPTLQSSEDLELLSSRLFALHWRLRDYTLRHQAMDFAKFSQEAWFGPLDISAFRLIDSGNF